KNTFRKKIIRGDDTLDRVMLIGGPGNISHSTMLELLIKGFEVGVYTIMESIGPEFAGNIRHYTGNRDDTACLKAALLDFKPDDIIDFVCFEQQQGDILSDLMLERVKQFIFISTVDAYGYPLSCLPMREIDPVGETRTQYALNKRMCEKLLLSKAEKQKLPLTIVRPAYSFGNEFLISFFSHLQGSYLITRLRESRPVLVPGDGTTLIHVSHGYNTGRMVAQLAGKDFTIGRSYTCGHDSFMTHDDYINLMAGAVGKTADIVHIPTDLLGSAGGEFVRESLHLALTRYNLAFSVDAFKSDFPDFEWKLGLDEGMQKYIEYNDRKGTFDSTPVEMSEDRIIKAWLECTSNFNIRYV
ncbi:MAG: NAD-dependent epimerase/dehydratase family protein, partial [Clostridiales bacterium]|nr:NAD-dependent epimerase/dehydratase family protein [Clostridiales bacterium]